MKYFGLIIMFCVFGCKVKAPSLSKESNVDTILIYSLPQFSSYLTNVDCVKIKKKEDVTVTKITDGAKIKELLEVIKQKNLEVNDSSIQLDIRMLMEFKSKEILIKTLCWSPLEFVKIDDKVYRYNKKVEDIFLKEKLIIKVN
ncbi:MAG: hypothetical protein F9K09_01435 [Flavobacteriales bacterium]|nr:MAG: hypothetical protein F9K09_01435 [Flavobacteriales bacterium]